MGAGKSTAARELGGTDADDLIESAAGKPIAEIFREEGEAAFRALEEQTIVLALGGGAVASPAVRDALADTLTIWLDVDVDTCWERVKESRRPLARDETEFRRLYEGAGFRLSRIVPAQGDLSVIEGEPGGPA